MTYSQNDIATVKARIEFGVKGGAQVVFTTPEGTEHRAQVADAAIIAVEAGPLKAGDKVFKGKGKSQVNGMVVHRLDDSAWVSWETGEPTIESVDALSR